jgi:SAM-dependent methyltransferase
MTTPSEKWASGDAYEQFMGRWSESVAARFLDGLQPVAKSSWLDIGCGTGALTRVIASRVQSNKLIGADLSLNFVQYASQQNLNARFVNASAIELPFCHNIFDFVVSGLALNFVPQPEQALNEFVRIVKPGGIVAAYVWDYADKMEFLRYFWDAALALNPDAKRSHEGYRFPICHPDALQALWRNAGLIRVSSQPLDVETVFENFDSYWQSFMIGNFPAPQYALALDDKSRAELQNCLRTSLPTEADGSIHLIARAWSVHGEKSGG